MSSNRTSGWWPRVAAKNCVSPTAKITSRCPVTCMPSARVGVCAKRELSNLFTVVRAAVAPLCRLGRGRAGVRVRGHCELAMRRDGIQIVHR
jgi:hypothetical protein